MLSLLNCYKSPSDQFELAINEQQHPYYPFRFTSNTQNKGIARLYFTFSALFEGIDYSASRGCREHYVQEIEKTYQVAIFWVCYLFYLDLVTRSREIISTAFKTCKVTVRDRD
jgi:hypothetical protein